MSKKPIIFYCDDNSKETDEFKHRHSGRFKVETFNPTKDNDNSMEVLENLIKNKKTPDIILVNLSRENTDDVNELARCKAEGKKLLEEIEKVRVRCDPYYERYGITLLKSIRNLRECHDIPIAIYTKYGLIYEASNDDFQTVAEENGEWMRKGGSKLYEEYRLDSMLKTKRYADVTKKTLMIFFFFFFLVSLPYSFFFNLDFLVVGATLASLLLGVMPCIIAHFARIN
jgi:hypothetical protein